MNYEVFLAALSLLVTVLAEGRSIWKDQQRKSIRANGIMLFQLLLVLDNIIDVGDELIGVLSEIPMTENAVECVFSIRLLHHFGKHDDRLALLKEFSRVASDSIILSLWVEGNYQAWRRKRMEFDRKKRRYDNRFVIPVGLFEEEVAESGLRIDSHFDLFPYLSMWRTYVLRK